GGRDRQPRDEPPRSRFSPGRRAGARQRDGRRSGDCGLLAARRRAAAAAVPLVGDVVPDDAGAACRRLRGGRAPRAGGGRGGPACAGLGRRPGLPRPHVHHSPGARPARGAGGRRGGGPRDAIPSWRCGLVLLLADVGRVATVQRELADLGARGFTDLPRDITWLVSMALLSETAALLGDRATAGVLYELLEPYGERCVVFGYGLACWGSVSRHLGLLATTLSRWEQATGHFETA